MVPDLELGRYPVSRDERLRFEISEVWRAGTDLSRQITRSESEPSDPERRCGEDLWTRERTRSNSRPSDLRGHMAGFCVFKEKEKGLEI
jgi:hypothetical protein